MDQRLYHNGLKSSMLEVEVEGQNQHLIHLLEEAYRNTRLLDLPTNKQHIKDLLSHHNNLLVLVLTIPCIQLLHHKVQASKEVHLIDLQLKLFHHLKFVLP